MDDQEYREHEEENGESGFGGIPADGGKQTGPVQPEEPDLSGEAPADSGSQPVDAGDSRYGFQPWDAGRQSGPDAPPAGGESGRSGGWQSGGEGYGDNSSVYHYSYVSQPGYTSQPHPAQQPPQPEPPKKKRRGGIGRAIALVLCCALVGGGAGVGGAALYGALNHEDSAPVDVYRNDTDPTPVEVHKADGLTPMSLSEIDAAYADSCVCVTVQAVVQQGFYQYQATGAGSGFIISEDGYIVTNYHVIDDATAIQVTLNNGESYEAKLIGGEELNDVAVLKIDGITGLKPVVIGDSDDLVVGETVCTIGNALGTLSFSLTSGAVSATGRSITMSDGTVMNMIQTDCTINAGNSGGPLFDSYGRVAGITSAKFSNNGDSSEATIEGIGFAIPINDVIDIVTDYIEHGYVTGRPLMGINGATVTDEYSELFGWPSGVVVTSVTEGSCAQRAGLRQNDIITKIDDTDITDIQQMISVKNSYRAGDTVTITLYRSGETLTVQMTFDEQTNETQDSGSGARDPAPQETASNGYGDGYSNGNGYGNGFGFDPWSFFGW